MYKPLFLLMALFVGTAFAADGVVASRTIPSNLTNNTTDNDTSARATSRTTVSRSKATSDAKETSRGTATETRSTVSRSTTARTTNSASRGTTTRTSGSTKNTVSRSTVGDINSDPAVRRAGVVLRPSFADYGGRATIAGTDRQTGSNINTDIQKLANRATKNVQATKESIADAREKLELTAELNKSCQEQYNECMDQFCAVIDANQKRCSCSSNLSRYTKVEKAVTEANTKLNEVAQAIRYVGLSADEIRAIMTETEAEEALDDNKDTSTTRNMLKQIESMIKDPTSSTTSYSSDTTFGFGLDMDLTFSSDPIDIFNLDFLNTNMNSSSISKLRGTELYNTAKKRCNTILTQCKDAGATQAQITGNYDLAIDKDCLEYEAGLKKMNDTLLSNVKSANLMLQKARLAVMENKNQYDARGCVGALESCMKDDMVCGDDYYKCVDPTKTYIDENGDVVLGQDITIIQSFMTAYNNAAIDKDYLSSAYSTKIGANTCQGDGKCVVKYLLQKIGTKEKATDEGLCRPVLDKCQLYTYDSKTSKYKPYNDVVVNYIQRAMVSIKAAQQKIISDYASTCIMDVATCYNQQVTQVNSWASAASASNIYSVMRGACRSVALTCGLAIFTGEPEIPNTVIVGGTSYTASGCTHVNPNMSYGSSDYNGAIINCVSDMFYQSLLCPDNSQFQTTEEKTAADKNGTNGGYVNTRCKCNDGYTVWGGACVVACGPGQSRNISGTCWCSDAEYTELRNGVCYKPNSNEAHPDSDVTTNSSSSTPTQVYLVSFTCGTNGTGSGQTISVNAGTNINLNSYNGLCSATSGYEFSGWSCGSGTGTIRIDAPLSCEAQWRSTGSSTPSTPTTQKYTLRYTCGEATGGNPPNSVSNISAGTSWNLPSGAGNCYKTGSSFNGWKCTGSNDIVASVTVNGDTTCAAQWTNNGGITPDTTVYVTFDCGAHSSTGTWQEAANNGSLYVNTFNSYCVPESGYTFSSWSCGSGTITVTNGTTCTAQWTGSTPTTQKYTLTYTCGEATGGTPPDRVTNISAGTSWNLPSGANTCAKTGSTFNGWKCTGSNNIVTSVIVNSNTDCVAQWTNNSGVTPEATVYVTFNCGEHSSTGTWQESANNGSLYVNAYNNYCIPESGYVFDSWSCGSGTITVTNGTTCTAQWTESSVNQYTIHYDCAGGSNNSISDQTCTQGESFNVTPVSECGTKNGEYAVRWNNSGESSYTCNGSRTFTALYRDSTVSFSCGEGYSGQAPASQKAYDGETIVLPDNVNSCTNGDATAIGWSCSPTQGDGSFDLGGLYTVRYSSITCTVRWSGSSNPDLAPQAVTTANQLNSETNNSLQATPLRSSSSYSLIQTTDMCMLYSTPSGTSTSDFVAMTDCSIDLNSL